MESSSSGQASKVSTGASRALKEPTKSSSSLRIFILTVLPLLSALGAYLTWGLSGSNGLFDFLEAVIKPSNAKLPNSDAYLVKTYTGFGPADRTLTILVTFFAPMVDYSDGSLTLFSIFGLGQFGAAWTLMQMESMRAGNSWKAVSFIGIVGFLIQNATFTVVTPLWLLLHLFTSPVAKGNSSGTATFFISGLDLKLLPVSIILGYIVPSIAMSLPSPDIVSPTMHQNLIALWQPFPIWTVIIQWALRTTFQAGSSNPDPRAQTTAPGLLYLQNAKYVYRFVLALCLLTQIHVVAIVFLPDSIPDLPVGVARLLPYSFMDVFVPYTPYPSHKISTLGEGILSFFQWDMYVGAAALLLWSILLHHDATADLGGRGQKLKEGDYWGNLLVKVFSWTVVSGPLGAVTILLWERDTIVSQKSVEKVI